MRKPLLLLAILAALTWTGASYGDPTSRIAFTSSRDGDSDIYVMNTDGSDPHRVADTGTHDMLPCWSPDGSRIAYGSMTGDGSFWMVNRDGSENTRFYVPGMGMDFGASVDWSPDGAYFAFAGTTDGTFEIILAPVDNLEITPIVSPGNDYKPDWSPDGSKIAYNSFREGEGAGRKLNIWVMEADGFNPIQLTDPPAHDDAPAWSPDGSRIAFASNRTDDWEIWVMNADGSDPAQITDSPGMDREPTWSPDGTQIAFATQRDGNWEVYAMNADGSNQTNLTNHPESDLEPAWSSNIEQPATLVEVLSWGWIKAGSR